MSMKRSLGDLYQHLPEGRLQTILTSEDLPWKRILNWIGVSIGILFLGFTALLVWRSRDTLVAVLRTAHYEYFLGVFGLYSLSIAWVALGWHLVMRHLRAGSSLLVDLKAYVYTLAARRLPGKLWYIAGRAALSRQLGISARISALSSGIEVVLSIVSGLIVGTPALLMQTGGARFAVVLVILAELVGLAVLHPRVLRRLLGLLGHQLEPGSLAFSRVLSWLGAYTLMWICGGLMTYAVIAAIHPVGTSEIPRIISLWALTGVISLAGFLLPSNLGLSEVALSSLLSSVIPLSIAVATALLVRILTTLFDVMWSSLLLWDRSGLLGRHNPE